MGKVTYGFNVSLDGFIEDATGNYDWSEPDEAVHRHYNERERNTGLHLYGRGLYEVMRFWGAPTKIDRSPNSNASTPATGRRSRPSSTRGRCTMRIPAYASSAW